MDFTEYKCPSCDKQFNKNDDIVVCPECGTPQHRECYDNLGHCVYADKHSEDFSFQDMNKKESSDESENFSKTVTCSVCNTENSHELFYCQKCGAPLTDKKENHNQQHNNQQNNNQQFPNFNQGNFSQFNVMFDPMAGLNHDEPIADDVTAGEMAKFVGKSTPYYLRVFKNIKDFKVSRFNFSAFILSGIFFLYRKMYALGILFTTLILGLTVAQLYIQTLPTYIQLYTEILNAESSQYVYSLNLSGYSNSEILFFSLPFVIDILILALNIICGTIANRQYYKHSIKKIKAIKANKSTEDLSKTIENTGGVNLPITICTSVIYIAISNLFLFI